MIEGEGESMMAYSFKDNLGISSTFSIGTSRFLRYPSLLQGSHAIRACLYRLDLRQE